ncbi:murein L,D-transpeptidase catalytic domain family protein [Stutzerimonas tarimensis]|uniref:Murein L,D-transpeptidase catalytic domain family protein n=1 Tax=Stutzerimonas tarimensis TaxID=1507735 RepID=A0ABV7T4C2_9GAMM
MRHFFGRICLAFGLLLWSHSSIASALTDSLARVAPSLDTRVLQQAVSAMQCAVRNGASPAARLAVVDYSRPSSEPRLWIFDLNERRLLLEEFVAHGSKSGENLAERFSNILGSHQTSLGLFRTAESYQGRHGYSLRMDGMEPGVNDRARERAIVIHGADYVDPDWIPRQGRIGRSQGCPAVRRGIAETVVDNLKDGQFLFSWYPDPHWLETSVFLNCDAQRVASLVRGS